MAQPVFPTKSNLIQTKKSLSFAKVGFELLDRKRNVLMREIMGLMDEASSLRGRIQAAYKEAYEMLERAMVSLGMHEYIANNIPLDDRLSVQLRSVMGVEIPMLSLPPEEPGLYYPLASTGMLVDECYLKFSEVKQLTVQLAQVETGAYRLAVAIKKTQKRANALKNIIIPNLTATTKCITDALEEKEREDFSRLKVIKAQKNTAPAKTAE